MNCASTLILARVVGAFAVISAGFFLISGEASRLPLVRQVSHFPMAFQSAHPLFCPPALPNNETIMTPAIRCQRGLPPSGLMALVSFTSDCHASAPPDSLTA